MNAFRLLALGLIVSSFALVSSDGVFSQDKKEKSKGQLPANWGKLGLSDEQKALIYKIQGEYKEKITKLEAEIKSLTAERNKKMAEQLTSEQKTKLAELTGIEDTKKDKDKGKEKEKEKGKEKDKEKSKEKGQE